jgi:hypothetical protein
VTCVPCFGGAIFFGFSPLVGWELIVAAEAVDEAAVTLGGAFGWGSEVEWAKELSLFGGLATRFFALFGFAVEGLGDGGRAALLAEGEDLDVELAGFIFDVEHVADADFAGGLGGDVVRGDAVHVAGFGGLLAGFEEAGGPEPLVDARAGHAFYFEPFI